MSETVQKLSASRCAWTIYRTTRLQIRTFAHMALNARRCVGFYTNVHQLVDRVANYKPIDSLNLPR